MNGNAPIPSLPNSQFSRTSTAALSQQSTLVGTGGSEALRSAVLKFKARLSGTDLTDFKNTTYESLCHELMRVQYEQEQTKTMANMGRLQSFLEAMEQFSKIIEVFLNVNEVVCFVWGPIKFLLLVRSQYNMRNPPLPILDCQHLCGILRNAAGCLFSNWRTFATAARIRGVV